ncbi:telomeric repeat-binding factor 1 [Cynoglossus semilaevis]|uniref:telomeric repeat-binding factor 1 n=1 Tax=Cynoglossus semilaevis TaxID=244447 RepID=UPI0004966FC7|nr:telomeric repeat-binding factor 1 [Cynoglossus semilaevis]
MNHQNVNMESNNIKSEKETDLEQNNVEESVCFKKVARVATDWMLDFMFLKLCRHFKEQKFEEFNQTLAVFESMSVNSPLNGDRRAEKTLISAFLARVMHGKELDCRFDDGDDCVMPLMSASTIWPKLQDAVADGNVFKNITILLFVQSVAVCLEKDQHKSASSALKWFDNNLELPKNLAVKVATVVSQRKTYHPLLTTFSFNHLLASVQSFLDAYLEENPSDYLLKEATKAASSSKNCGDLKDSADEDTSETANISDKEPDKKLTKENRKKNLRTKRSLMSTKITNLWLPDSPYLKKPCISVKRLSEEEITLVTSPNKMEETMISRRRGKKKWTPGLDQCLIEGVKRHGVGKWARILLDDDFEGRTGTMLKDRWRVLVKLQLDS